MYRALLHENRSLLLIYTSLSYMSLSCDALCFAMTSIRHVYTSLLHLRPSLFVCWTHASRSLLHICTSLTNLSDTYI